MPASAVFNAATATNVNVLRSTNALFQLAQKRVSSGKSIFSTADNAPKFTMSDRILSRIKNLETVNNGISTNLAALGNTEKTLNQIKGLLDQMSKNVNSAINASASTSISGRSVNNFTENKAVHLVSVGHRLSITSDNGRNFTFTFESTTTTWGQVAKAFNDANIGVTIRFLPSTVADESNLVIESTDGKTGFTIDGSSSRQAARHMLWGMRSTYDGGYNDRRFVDDTLRPSGLGDSPTGMRFGSGGILTTAEFANSKVSAGTSLTFLGADGVARTWSTSTAKNIDLVLDEINALNSGIKAERVQTDSATSYKISLRNLSGGTMTVLNGTGAFDSGPATGGGRGEVARGAARFNGPESLGPRVDGTPIQGSADTTERLKFGRIYNNARSEITALLENNVTPQGRNLLWGQDITIFLNEFAGGGQNSGLVVEGKDTKMGTAGWARLTLGLNTNGASWHTLGGIHRSKAEIDAAKSTVLELQAQFGTYTSMVKNRYNLNKEFASGLEALANEIVATDMGEESAKLTALQTQQQFAVQTFTAGSQNAQGLLRLLG